MFRGALTHDERIVLRAGPILFVCKDNSFVVPSLFPLGLVVIWSTFDDINSIALLLAR